MGGAARTIAEFASKLTFSDLPGPVAEQAALGILDAVGVAFAATTYPDIMLIIRGIDALGDAGTYPAIGTGRRLTQRDSVLVNGTLIHGLDFDDTLVPSLVHGAASMLPVAMAVGSEWDISGQHLIASYVAGMEVAARLGSVTTPHLHNAGFHPTGVVGAFGAVITAGVAGTLDLDALVHAQGIVGSAASGLLAFLDDGSWTKRLHPGSAGAAAVTAAVLARVGWTGPEAVYEGRNGLFATHLPGRDIDVGAALTTLGSEWWFRSDGLKPYPTCLFTHPYIEAAIALAAELGHGDTIESVRCLMHPDMTEVVGEPAATKRHPRGDYEAKFSLYFTVAASLLRARFTLRELEAAALSDPALGALADKVSIEPDPESEFPDRIGGSVEVRTTNGRVLSRRVDAALGSAERPLGQAEVVAKFRNCMELADRLDLAEQIIDTTLGLVGAGATVRSFTDVLA